MTKQIDDGMVMILCNNCHPQVKILEGYTYQKIQRLRTALQFYADEGNYGLVVNGNETSLTFDPGPIQKDQGQTAREALNA